jgi:hypothetical protein
MIRWALRLGMAAFGWLAGCSSNTAEPVAAALDVVLSSPAADDGAVLLTIAGGPIDSLEAPGYRLYTNRPAADTLRLIVAGDLTPGRIARVYVADGQRVPQYSATINQVAARRTYRLRDLAEYTVTLSH